MNSPMENVKTMNSPAISSKDVKYAKVLLLDDNPLDNFVNKKLIEQNNFALKVEMFESAIEVLAYLKKEQTDHLPDIIFLDIMMPLMDGFTFLEEFEKLDKRIQNKCKIVMVSSSESFKDLNRANKNPFVYKFLNKPLNDMVINAINI